MSDEYLQIGGMRFGFSGWLSGYATIPFAMLRVSKESLRITLGIWKLGITFKFTPSDIVSIKKRKILFYAGIVVEHNKKKSLPFIMFGTLNYPKLKMELNRFGYHVMESGQSEVSGLRS
jgi:hypothetical protein